uniref:WD_REPEATS_REGION domain-containing protein n=1 Tax=Dracunculus medinensis TaxID=318479 RepID=A0A0N4UHG1_DRAME
LSFHIRTVSLGVENCAESLIWVGESLISSHTNGSIIVHDLHGAEIVGFASRIFSLASNENLVAAGCVDDIFLIELKTKKLGPLLKLPRDEKRKPTISYTVFCRNDLLISGDSRGFVCIWDSLTGSLHQVNFYHLFLSKIL